MLLTDLIAGSAAAGAVARELDVTGLTCHSRRVEPGFLFAALPGTRADGRAFVGEAVRRGAVAVLGPPGTWVEESDSSAPLVTEAKARRR